MAPRCALCGECGYDLLHRLPIGLVRRCRECGLVALQDGTGSRLATCSYGSSYFSGGDPGRPWGYVDYAGAERRIRGATADAIIMVVESFAARGSLLDIGCGGGYLVRASLRRGWEASGVDPSAAAYAIAMQEEDLAGRITIAHTADLAKATVSKLNVVTMLDVVEHLPEPVSVMRDALSLLTPGGTLFVTTPRFDGPLYRKQRERYVQFKSDHVHYFTETTLARVVEAAGVLDWRILPLSAALRSGARDADPAVLRKYEVDRDALLLVAVVGS